MLNIVEALQGWCQVLLRVSRQIWALQNQNNPTTLQTAGLGWGNKSRDIGAMVCVRDARGRVTQRYERICTFSGQCIKGRLCNARRAQAAATFHLRLGISNCKDTSMLPLISLKCVWVVLGRGGGVDRCREAWDEDASVPITVAGRRLCCDAGRGSDPSLWLDDDDDADPLEFASKSRSTGGICVLTFLVI